MARLIEFDAERLIGRLSILQASQFKYASTQAVNRLGFAVREQLINEMQTNFRNPVPHTLGSPYYVKADVSSQTPTLLIGIKDNGSKGNAPVNYLYPTDAGSPGNTAYLTRFARGLRKTGVTSMFPVPYKQGSKVKRNSYGNMLPSQYRVVLDAVQGKGGTIFALPRGSAAGRLPPGIYQREGRLAFLLFKLLDDAPNVSQQFSFYGTTLRVTNDRLPTLLREELDKALR